MFGVLRKVVQPFGIFGEEIVGALAAGFGADMPDDIGEVIVKVLAVASVDHLHRAGVESVIGKKLQHFLAMVRVNPSGVEVGKIADFFAKSLGNSAFVFLSRDELPVSHGESPQVVYPDIQPAGADFADGDGFVGVIRRFFSIRLLFESGAGGKFLTHQDSGVCVVVDGEGKFSGFLVYAGSASQHLVEKDGGFDMPKKDDISDARNVHAGGEEVDSGGDESAVWQGSKAADKGGAIHISGAFKRVFVRDISAVFIGELDAEVLHFADDILSVRNSFAKNDGFLVGSVFWVIFAELLKEVGTHGADAVRELKVFFKSRGGVVGAEFGFGDGVAGVGVGWFELREFFAGDSASHVHICAGFVQQEQGKVSVVHSADDRIFIDGFAEVLNVVGVYSLVLLPFFGGVNVLGNFEGSGSCGQSDVDGSGVSAQRQGPFPIGGTVAFVYDDVGEIVLLRVKSVKCYAAIHGVWVWVVRVTPHAKGLICGDVDFGAFGGIFAAPIGDDNGISAEFSGEFSKGLLPEFLAVAEKKDAAKFFGACNAVEEINGDESFTRAGGKRQEDALGLSGFFATRYFFHCGANGGVLIIAAIFAGGRVSGEERYGGGAGKKFVQLRKTARFFILLPELVRSGECGHFLGLANGSGGHVFYGE